ELHSGREHADVRRGPGRYASTTARGVSPGRPRPPGAAVNARPAPLSAREGSPLKTATRRQRATIHAVLSGAQLGLFAEFLSPAGGRRTYVGRARGGSRALPRREWHRGHSDSRTRRALLA